jgi:hypothetical protein
MKLIGIEEQMRWRANGEMGRRGIKCGGYRVIRP